MSAIVETTNDEGGLREDEVNAFACNCTIVFCFTMLACCVVVLFGSPPFQLKVLVVVFDVVTVRGGRTYIWMSLRRRWITWLPPFIECSVAVLLCLSALCRQVLLVWFGLCPNP